VDNYRKGYGGVMTQRAPIMRKFNFVPVYFPGGVDIWALMLIGMALFKLGVLQGERSPGFYVRLALAGYAIGIPVNALSTYGCSRRTSISSRPRSGMCRTKSAGWRGAGPCLGHHPARQGRGMKWLTDRLAAVGQMAFSNYISHSIIYALVFYAPGLRLFGQLQRYQLYYIVLGMWILSLAGEPDLAAPFPIRPARVVLAVVDLLEAATDAPAVRRSSRRVRSRLVRCG
jgi:uncharacterized protein